VNSKKWIGTTEACVFFRSLSIPCDVIDFSKAEKVSTSKNEKHPKLFDYAFQYFKKRNSSLSFSQKKSNLLIPPLFLQHDGHSSKKKKKINLFLF
jgi:hypothetical protein